MGLWSKGLIRAQTGELRMEESVSELLESLGDFLSHFYKPQYYIPIFELIDNVLYIRIGIYHSRATIKEKSHMGMMQTLLECVNNILIHTRDVNRLFFLRDKIVRNLNFYKESKKLEDLYFV